jgi:hypothetical protein
MPLEDIKDISLLKIFVGSLGFVLSLAMNDFLSRLIRGTVFLIRDQDVPPEFSWSQILASFVVVFVFFWFVFFCCENNANVLKRL